MTKKNLEGALHCGAHCRACGEHFRSVAAFDLHRSGSFKRLRRCRKPQQVKTRDGHPKLEVMTDTGICTLLGQREENVTVWKEVE